MHPTQPREAIDESPRRGPRHGVSWCPRDGGGERTIRGTWTPNRSPPVGIALAAIERLATWFGQQGGGWLDAYGLHVLYLAILLGCLALLGRLHRDAAEAPEADQRHRLRGPRATSRHALLFPYEAAYLAGGPGRVVEVALASLLDEGWIASSAGGRLRLGQRGDLVAAPDPVAISVLAVVAGGPPASARDVRRRAARLREVHDVSGILYARRLVVAEAARRRLRRLRWAASVLLGAGGAALLVAAVSRSPGLTSPAVIAAAAALVVGPVAPLLAGAGTLFRTAAGESELGALRGRVLEKAHWVAGRVWSDRAGASPEGPWADVDRIVDALARPATGRPVQLGWLWGREDGLTAIALRGAPAIPDRGLRRGLLGGRRGAAGSGSSTGLSTPVHNIVRPDDA